MPVIAVGEIEEGRVMAITTDGSWRWSFERAGDGATAREYQMFWNNTMRWLIKDPELKLLRVEIEQDAVAPGEAAQVTVRLQNPDYTPAPDTKGILIVSHRPLDRLDSAPLEPVKFDFQTDARGVAILAIPAPKSGVYEVTAEVERPYGTLADRELFLSTETTAEFSDILPRPDLLKKITAHTLGGFETAPNAPALSLKAPQAVQVNKRVVIQLWDSLLLFVFVLGLLLTEWTLRRRWGRL